MMAMFSSAKLYIMGAMLLAVVSSTAWVTHRLDSATLERWKSAQATQAARDNALALAQLQAHDAAAQRALNELVSEKAAREAEVQSLRSKIAHAPKTRACVDSPAIRALVDGLQRGGSTDRH